MVSGVARIESVNVGHVVDVPWGSLKKSAIDKRPAQGHVKVHTLGLGGDEIADLKRHGGADKAVYAFAGEERDHWATELGRDLLPGQFGENLSTRGIDVDDARIGDRWRIGTVVLEVADVRIPCSVFQGFLGEKQWIKRFSERGRVGAYLRVIEEGEVAAGDDLEVLETRDHDLSVAYTFRAVTTQRDLLPSLAQEARCGAAIKRELKKSRVCDPAGHRLV
ncbi:MAG: MOSC domain-containing protein [Kineosporiaceae bacterium]|nr:MOSC domain-containing protein [Aeromicrobium sp.]